MHIVDKILQDYYADQFKKTDENPFPYKRTIVIHGKQKTFNLSITEKEYQQIKKILMKKIAKSI
jgi:hypothetical protein